MRTFADILRQLFGTFWAFLLGRLMIAIAISALAWPGLRAAGCPLPGLFAVLIGMVVVVPLLPMVIVVAAAITTLLTGDAPRWLPAFEVLLIGIALQIIEAYLLTPVVLGRRLKLGCFTVLWATILFGIILGFLGVLFAAPLAAAAEIIGRGITDPVRKRAATRRS